MTDFAIISYATQFKEPVQILSALLCQSASPDELPMDISNHTAVFAELDPS